MSRSGRIASNSMGNPQPRVIVCGGRRYEDALAVELAIVWLATLFRDPIIVDGAARGADTLAHRAAASRALRCERHPANWAKFGKGAGAVRNVRMLELGADLVLAFPGGKGTRNMLELAVAVGVRVVLWGWDIETISRLDLLRKLPKNCRKQKPLPLDHRKDPKKQ